MGKQPQPDTEATARPLHPFVIPSEEAVRAAIGLVWRNLPSHASTFSLCECGRGGGPCIHCAQDMLAEAIGGDTFLAYRYVTKAKALRRMETSFVEWATGKNEKLSD